MSHPNIPRVITSMRRLGVGPDRLPKFARESDMDHHNKMVKHMRDSSLAIFNGERTYTTVWKIVKQEAKP